MHCSADSWLFFCHLHIILHDFCIVQREVPICIPPPSPALTLCESKATAAPPPLRRTFDRGGGGYHTPSAPPPPHPVPPSQRVRRTASAAARRPG